MDKLFRKDKGLLALKLSNALDTAISVAYNNHTVITGDNTGFLGFDGSTVSKYDNDMVVTDSWDIPALDATISGSDVIVRTDTGVYRRDVLLQATPSAVIKPSHTLVYEGTSATVYRNSDWTVKATYTMPEVSTLQSYDVSNDGEFIIVSDADTRIYKDVAGSMVLQDTISQVSTNSSIEALGAGYVAVITNNNISVSLDGDIVLITKGIQHNLLVLGSSWFLAVTTDGRCMVYLNSDIIYVGDVNSVDNRMIRKASAILVSGSITNGDQFGFRGNYSLIDLVQDIVQ